MGKIRTLLATAAGGLALAGCEAGATDKKTPETAEFTKLAAVVETTVRTQAECRALVGATKEEKLTCMREVKAARQAEIAALNEKIEDGNTKTEILREIKEAVADKEPSP